MVVSTKPSNNGMSVDMAIVLVVERVLVRAGGWAERRRMRCATRILRRWSRTQSQAGSSTVTLGSACYMINA